MNINSAWAAALEDSAPVAEFDITVNPEPEIDYDEDGAPLEAVDADGEPTFDVVETEMVEDAAEVEEAEAVAEKLEDTAVQLESAAVAVEDRIHNHGGMTGGELHFMMIGLEGRIKNGRRLFPSNEAFSDSRLSASNEALESIRSGIQAIWKALRDAITAVLNKLRQWFGTTLRGAVKLKKRANGVIAAASRITQTAVNEKKITLNSVQSFVSSGGKVASTGDGAQTQLVSLTAVTKQVLSPKNVNNWNTYVNAYNSVLEDLMTVHDNNSGEFDEAAVISKVTSIKDWATAGYGKLGNTSETSDRFKGFNTTATGSLPGGKRVFMMTGPSAGTPTTLAAFNEAQAHRGVRVASITEGAKAPKKAQEFETLTISEIQDLAGRVNDIASIIVDYETSWNKRDKAIQTVQKAIDKAVKKVEAKKGDYAGSAKQQQVTGGVLRAIANELKAAPRNDATFIQYALTTSNDYLLYCTRSIAQYKEPKAKKGDKA